MIQLNKSKECIYNKISIIWLNRYQNNDNMKVSSKLESLCFICYLRKFLRISTEGPISMRKRREYERKFQIQHAQFNKAFSSYIQTHMKKIIHHKIHNPLILTNELLYLHIQSTYNNLSFSI